MFFGVSMSPMGWLITLLCAFFAMFIPVFIIGFISELFPAAISGFVFFVLFIAALPACLCWLYSRKIFAQGRASIFFWFYLLFYVAFGLFMMTLGDRTYTSPEGEVITNTVSFIERLGGALIAAVGVAMFLWSRKEKKTFNLAVQDGIVAEREDQINMQAEAILRAEKMKKDQGL